MAHGKAFPTRRAMMHKKRQSDESSAPDDPVQSSLITTGQTTASRNAKTAELPSRTAQATGDWGEWFGTCRSAPAELRSDWFCSCFAAQTAGLERTTVEPSSTPTRVAASTNSAAADGGWDSLSDGAHIGIYVAAAVVGALILVSTKSGRISLYSQTQTELAAVDASAGHCWLLCLPPQDKDA